MSSRSETALTDGKYVPAALKWMIIVAGVLIAVGAINVYSATYYMNIKAGEGPYTHLIKHLFMLAIAVGSGLFASWLPKGAIRRFAPLWVLVTLVLLLAVTFAGTTVNGATRWIRVGGISLQPSEIAKVTGLIWVSSFLAMQAEAGEKFTLIKAFFRPLAHIGERKKKRKDTFRFMLLYFLPLYGPLLMAILVLRQPDMGTAGMILIFPVLLYVILGLPGWEIVAGIVVAVAAFIVLVIFEPYRLDRVTVLIDPFRYSSNLGYQIVQSLIAVGSGGWLGQSFGEGMAKFLYLPEQYTDFAFAVFSQEFGFVGSVSLLLLYLAFLLCGFHVAKQLKEIYAALLVYGLTMLIAIQGILNITMVIGWFPVTGVPLPFISFGGTSLIMNVTALGLIWGTTVQSLTETDRKERRRRIHAMEGRGTY